MTGNVAQVFLSDISFETSLKAIFNALAPGGHLVFEVRDPSKRAWLSWTKQNTYCRITIPEIGAVVGWCDVTAIAVPLVTFRWDYIFESSGETLTSDSTLRFRERDEIERTLAKSGYRIIEIRDAPDRPGLEYVFVAQRTA